MTEAEEPGGGSIAVSDDQDDVVVDPARLEAVASHAFLVLEVPAAAGLSITLVGEDRIAELKEKFLGAREPTDVLSFPVDDPFDPAPGPMVLGEVAICPSVAERQARALGRPVEDEIGLLLVHGILHLLGRDHAEPEQERAMAAEERHVLRSFRARVAAAPAPAARPAPREVPT